MRVSFKCVSISNGVMFVMSHGVNQMLLLHVDSLALLMQVQIWHACTTWYHHVTSSVNVSVQYSATPQLDDVARIAISNLECMGDETRLVDCPVSDSKLCNISSIVGIKCTTQRTQSNLHVWSARSIN